MENVKMEMNFTPIAEFGKANETFVNTNPNQIDFYTKQAMEVFDRFQIDGSYTYDGVYKNVQTWWENKQKLMDIFRKHPLWNEEAKAIIFTRDECRPIDLDAAITAYNRLRRYVFNATDMSVNSNLLTKAFAYTYSNCACTVIDERFIEMFTLEASNTGIEIPKYVKSKLRVGVKITKFVNTMFANLTDYYGGKLDATKLVDFHEEGDRTYESYDKLFAKFADYLSELKIKKITLLSVNFNDFMTMSNGNSWSSCHFINSYGIFHEDSESSYRGAYKQGCLSYALDAPSFIFYTLPSAYKGNDYYNEQKLNRMCCQYSNGVIITGKCYPDNDDNKITQYRQIIQKVISECEEFSNNWTFSRRIERIEQFVRTARNSAHYPDYTFEHQNPTISIHKPLMIEDLDNMQMEIGHRAYCLDCGRELYAYDHDWLQCGSHRKKRICSCCGCVIGSDEFILDYDDEYYCEECVFYCDYHEKYEPSSRMVEIETENGTAYVCRSARDWNYVECHDCGRWVLVKNVVENARRVNGYIICNSCKENYARCSRCNRWYKANELHDGICEYCTTDRTVTTQTLVKQSEYEVGDYVVIVDTLGHHNEVCEFGTNDYMEENYTGRIVKITSKHMDYSSTRIKYYVSFLDEERWNWSANCFKGKIIGDVDDSMIGSIYNEEVM